MTLEEFTISTLSKGGLGELLGVSDKTIQNMRSALFTYNEEIGKGTLSEETRADYEKLIRSFTPSKLAISPSTSYRQRRGRPPKTDVFKRNTFILEYILAHITTRDDLSYVLRRNPNAIGTKPAKNLKRPLVYNPRNKEFACAPATAMRYLKKFPLDWTDFLDNRNGKREKLISVDKVSIVDTVDNIRVIDLKGRTGSFYLIVARINLTGEERYGWTKFVKLYHVYTPADVLRAIDNFYEELLNKPHHPTLNKEGESEVIAIKDDPAFKTRKADYDDRKDSLLKEWARRKNL